MVQNGHALKGLLNVNDQNAPPPENTDDTSVESVQLKTDRDAQILALHDDGHSQLEIERQLKIMGYTTGTSPKSIRKVITDTEQGRQKSDPLLVHTYRQSEKRPPPTNLDETGVESVQPPKADRDAQIIQLYKNEHSLRDIHSQMKAAGHKVSIGTINKVSRCSECDNPL